MTLLDTGVGFRHVRTEGSHHIYRHPDGLMLNAQPDGKRQAKLYQMRQLMALVDENGLSLER